MLDDWIFVDSRIRDRELFDRISRMDRIGSQLSQSNPRAGNVCVNIGE